MEPSTCGTEDNETSLSDHESFWGQDLYGDSWGLDLADDAVCGGGAGDLSPNTVQPPLGRWGFGSTVFGDGALLESGGEEAKAAWEREAGLCPPVESGAVCVGDAGEADGAKKDEDGRVLSDNASLEELVLVPVGTVAVGYFREVRESPSKATWGGAPSLGLGLELALVLRVHLLFFPKILTMDSELHTSPRN